ncbi:MAG: hypothetical protein E7639_00100 [Ruminococcaceae bacterium]|nr:hypothetical protein [Oscillospiraceae bacterium]
MKKLFRILTLVLVICLLTLSLVSCAAKGTVYASLRASRVVATVGDVEILYEELYFMAMNYIAELKEKHGENALQDEAVRAELDAFVWESFVCRETALISLGYEYGLDVFEGDIAASVQQEIEDMLENNFNGDRKAYVEALASQYMTDHYLRRFFAVEEELANAIVLEMLYRGEVQSSDAEVLATLRGESFVRTVHVFIDKNNAAYTEAQHRAHAAEVQASVAAATTDAARFEAMNDAIGGKYNHDFSDPLGKGYYFTYGEMDKAYEDAAFALDEYGVSDVVETEDGFFIIMRLPKDDDYITTNFEMLKGKSYFVTLNQKVDAKLSAMTLTKTKFGARLDLTALPEIDPDGGNLLLMWSAVALVAVAGGVVLLVVFRYRSRQKKGN